MKKNNDATTNFLAYKPEEDKLVIEGILTNFRYSTSKYKTDAAHYQVSVKTDPVPAEIIAAIKEKYFNECKEKFLPSFIKDAEKDPAAPLYFNLKSNYEIPCFVEGEGNTRYSYDDVIEKLGDGLAPTHSLVKLSIRLKDKAAYPLAVLFIEIRKQDASDYFE